MATKRMTKCSGTLTVLVILLAADRVRAQYANQAAESVAADNGNAPVPLEKSTDQFASICPCIIADQCSTHYREAADSPDTVSLCTERGAVRCCSAPLMLESELIEEQENAKSLGYHSVNSEEAPHEEHELKDHISPNYEEIEDSVLDRVYLKYPEKPEEQVGNDESYFRRLETSLETPSEDPMTREVYLSQDDEYQMEETLEQPTTYVHLGTDDQSSREKLPDTQTYSQVDPIASESIVEQVAEDYTPDGPRQNQHDEYPESLESVHQPNSRQAKVLNYAGPATVSMVIYPPSAYPLQNVPNQRRDSFQETPIRIYQQNAAPLTTQIRQRPVPTRDNFVLKVYGKPPSSQPTQKLFIKDKIDVSYKPPLGAAPHQRPITVPEYSAYSADTQQPRQPIPDQVQRQLVQASPQSSRQTSDLATATRGHSQLQQQQDVEYGSIGQNGATFHEWASQQPIYTQVSSGPIQEQSSHQQPLPTQSRQPINLQSAAWNSQNGQFHDQMIHSQTGMVQESSQHQQDEQSYFQSANEQYQNSELEPIYEQPVLLPGPQSGHQYHSNIAPANSDQQAPEFYYTSPETAADELRIPMPTQQGLPTRATNYEIQTESPRMPNVAPDSSYQHPSGIELQQNDSTSSQVQPQQQMTVEDVYEAQGLGMRSNQKLELAILEPLIPGPIEMPQELRKMPSPPKFELGFRPIVGPVTSQRKVQQPAATSTSYKQPIPLKMAQGSRIPYAYQNRPHFAVDQINRGSNTYQR